MGDRILIPAGSEMRGVITSLEKAGQIDRKGNMTLAFDQITVDGTRYPMHGTVTKAFEGEMKGEVGKLGVGAAAGAIIGGIIGGAKGAVGRRADRRRRRRRCHARQRSGAGAGHDPACPARSDRRRSARARSRRWP